MTAMPKPRAVPGARRVDPITLEVIRYSLVAMMDETEANLTRTAFSTIIREFKDYSVGLVTAKGETIAQGAAASPRSWPTWALPCSTAWRCGATT